MVIGKMTFAGGKVGFAYRRFLGLDNARIAQDQEEYQKRYDGMVGTIAHGFGSALFFFLKQEWEGLW